MSASPSSLPSAYQELFTWTIADGPSGSLVLSCPPGVSVLNASNSAVPCGSVNETGNGSLAFGFVNVSGAAQTVSATFTPNGTNGSPDYNGIARASFVVETVPQPILTFAVSSSTLVSGGSATFSWTGNYVPGANLIFDCVPGVTVSANGTNLPCGTNAFSSPLPATGSQPVTFTLAGSAMQSITVRVLPSTGSAYDAIHSQTTTLTLVPAAPPAPVSVASFTASGTTLYSGDSVDLSWNATGATTTALIAGCADDVTVLVNAATTSCQGLVPFSFAQGSTTLTLLDRGAFPRVLTMVLAPRDASGTTLANVGASLSFTVYPASMKPAPASHQDVAVATATTTAPSAHPPFTMLLKRGMTNAQVTALQQFLALDPAIYPEGLIIGTFGPATQRAVQRFQVRYAIAHPGDQGYGNVGPLTRTKLNALVRP